MEYVNKLVTSYSRDLELDDYASKLRLFDLCFLKGTLSLKHTKRDTRILSDVVLK